MKFSQTFSSFINHLRVSWQVRPKYNDIVQILEGDFHHISEVSNEMAGELFMLCFECLAPLDFLTTWLSTWLYEASSTAPAKLGVVRMRIRSIVIRRRSRTTAPASPSTPGCWWSSSPGPWSPFAWWPWRRDCPECQGSWGSWEERWRPTSRVTPASGFTTSWVSEFCSYFLSEWRFHFITQSLYWNTQSCHTLTWQI